MNRLYRLNDIKRNLGIARFRPLDVLVVGATGAGKSSTINALFEKEVAKIGKGCDPETMNIDSVNLNEYLRFWDSPGLGDNINNDKRYSKDLVDLLYKTYYIDNTRYGLIDMVLVILDGSGRDMGTTYSLLNEVIVPNFQIDRIIVAINQADMAMKGRHWDEEHNCPDRILMDFLEEKADSVRRRLIEATDLYVPKHYDFINIFGIFSDDFEKTNVTVSKPVFYSAERGYNIEKLLDMIIDNMPRERRNLVE